MSVRAHATNEHDSRAALPLAQEMVQVWPSLRFAHVDSAYVGAVTQELEAAGVTVTVLAKYGRCFKAQPVHWRIERTIAWLRTFAGSVQTSTARSKSPRRSSGSRPPTCRGYRQPPPLRTVRSQRTNTPSSERESPSHRPFDTR